MDEKMQEYIKQVKRRIIEGRDKQEQEARQYLEAWLAEQEKKVFGKHYVENFKPELVCEKEKIDKKLEDTMNGGKGFILSGDVGVGKTSALLYIYDRILRSHRREVIFSQIDISYVVDPDVYVQFYSAPKLFNRLHKGEKIKRMADFILIDDLGREYAESFSLSRFEIFVEDLYRDDYKVIITTNLTAEQFKNREDWTRIVDRFVEMCSWVEIKGTSRRQKGK